MHNNLGSTTSQEAAATANRQNASTAYQDQFNSGLADLYSLGLGPKPVAGQAIQGGYAADGTPLQTMAPSGTADTGGSGYGLIANLGLNQYNSSLAGGNTAIAQYENAAGLQNTTENAATSNPYQLTPAQQVELNTQVDTLNQRGQTAANNLKAEYAKRGITDPSAIASGLALLNQNTGALVNGYQAQYAEGARANAQNAAQQLASYYNTTAQQGMGALSSGVAGANNLIAEGAGGNLNASQANQGAAQSSQQQSNAVANQVGSTLGSIFGVAANAATGGYSNLFGGGSGGTASSGASINPGAFSSQPSLSSNGINAGTGNVTAYGAPIDNTAFSSNAYGAPVTGVGSAVNYGAPTSGNVFGGY